MRIVVDQEGKEDMNMPKQTPETPDNIVHAPIFVAFMTPQGGDGPGMLTEAQFVVGLSERLAIHKTLCKAPSHITFAQGNIHT